MQAKKIFGYIFIIFLLISVNVIAQKSGTQNKNYKPETLEEAIKQLDQIYPDSTKQQITKLTEKEFLNRTHFSTGMLIRNEWLYKRFLGFNLGESELRKNLAAKGLFNNDDMSYIILTSYYRHLNNQDLKVDQQIQDIHQNYKNMSNPEWVKEQQKKWWSEKMTAYKIGDTLTKKIYYDFNWLGTPKKNTLVTAIIKEKSDQQLKIEVISFEQEMNKNLIFQAINCKEENCWINPFDWQKLKENNSISK